MLEKLMWVVWISKAGTIVDDNEKGVGGHGDQDMRWWCGNGDNRTDNGGSDDD